MIINTKKGQIQPFSVFRTVSFSSAELVQPPPPGGNQCCFPPPTRFHRRTPHVRYWQALQDQKQPALALQLSSSSSLALALQLQLSSSLALALQLQLSSSSSLDLALQLQLYCLVQCSPGSWTLMFANKEAFYQKENF